MMLEKRNYFTNNTATEEEVNNYNLVYSYLDKEDDDFFDKFLEEVEDYILAMGNERKTAYNKIRKYMRRFNVTAKTLKDWYWCGA